MLKYNMFSLECVFMLIYRGISKSLFRKGNLLEKVYYHITLFVFHLSSPLCLQNRYNRQRCNLSKSFNSTNLKLNGT